jgi:hypothetical protein
MEYQELRDIAAKLRDPKDMLQVINNFLNTGGDTSMQLYIEGKGRWKDEARTTRSDKPICGWHPTLQQCLMRGFIVPAIRALADDPSPDERNRGTVRMCKEILPILDKYKLPFV